MTLKSLWPHDTGLRDTWEKVLLFAFTWQLTYPFLQVESSPGPISPSETERHNLSSGSGNSSANAGAPSSGASAHHHANQANQANNMPLSDNNVSTTNNMAMANTWDMTSAATHSPEQDINVSLALLFYPFCYVFVEYCKVASSNTSRLETYAGFFWLLMKGILDAYVLWPFEKKLIF